MLDSSSARMSRHHSFKVDPTHRDVEPRDEVLDRRRRKRAGLLDWSLDTKSRIYRMRHGRLSIDPQADGLYLNSNNSLGDLTVHPSENVKGRTPQRLPLGSVRTQMNGGALRRRHETTLNALAARNENIEDNLLAACEGRLSKKMLEFEPSSDMTGPEQAAWANVVQEIVTDFKDPSTARGRLVNKIKGTHYSLVNRGNLRLATNFAELGNSLARRLEQASSRRLDAEESEGDVFQAVGSYFESSDDTPQGELHTLVHINEIQSSHEKRSKDIIAFGQIETEGAWDLTDELVGSIFRYMVSVDLSSHHVSLTTTLILSRLHKRSSRFWKVIQSLERAFASRCAVISYAYFKSTRLVSAPPLHTASEKRQTMRKLCVPWLFCAVHPLSCWNIGLHLSLKHSQSKSSTGTSCAIAY
jgi:hypothetical protein